MKHGMRPGFLGISYHYVRPKPEEDRFARLLGARGDEFHEHVERIRAEYAAWSIDDMRNFFSGNPHSTDKLGILFTFDDGLSDHYEVARLLHSYNIRAIFFIPTCIIQDVLPASPTIIHYVTAYYGVGAFVDVMKEECKNAGLDASIYSGLSFEPGKTSAWETIRDIKLLFKYKIPHAIARNILLAIYRNTLNKDFTNAIEIMHLTKAKIVEIIAMGHTIGAHTRTHVSVAASMLSEQEFEEELIRPKEYLEKEFGIDVSSLSYPFGQEKDCLDTEVLIKKTNSYSYAFTTEQRLNTKQTSPFEIGRVRAMSGMNADALQNEIESAIKRSTYR